MILDDDDDIEKKKDKADSPGFTMFLLIARRQKRQLRDNSIKLKI